MAAHVSKIAGRRPSSKLCQLQELEVLWFRQASSGHFVLTNQSVIRFIFIKADLIHAVFPHHDKAVDKTDAATLLDI